MVTDGAHIRSLGCGHQMATVATFPHDDTGLLKDGLGLHIVQQGTIALLVGLLDDCDATELLCQVVEAFLRTHKEFTREKLALPAPFPENETGMLTLIPGQYDTDGFFICRLRRSL